MLGWHSSLSSLFSGTLESSSTICKRLASKVWKWNIRMKRRICWPSCSSLTESPSCTGSTGPAPTSSAVQLLGEEEEKMLTNCLFAGFCVFVFLKTRFLCFDYQIYTKCFIYLFIIENKNTDLFTFIVATYRNAFIAFYNLFLDNYSVEEICALL